MRAVLTDAGGNLVWSNVADPEPKENEVVIDVRAAGLNRADLMQRAGEYPSPPGWPEWMGLEVAGVISQAPEKGRWSIGDRVCALLGGGGYAEKVAAPADMVLPIPEGLSFEEAAAIPEAFATSYLNLFMEGKLKRGETVFIQAGASGLGTAAIQMAKVAGAKVVTTVGSEEKAEFARGLGADIVINREKENIAAVLAGNPADVAMDCVAGPDLGSFLVTMARGGRWIIIATLGGDRAEIDIRDLFRRGVRLLGSTLRSRSSEMKFKILHELEKEFWPAISSGKIKVVIHATLPVTRVEQAHAILQARENRGKVVLTFE